ncbi:hypothetical protein FRB90_008641 [Tulasnella sp. 427]|nr:hypothetical protein FRB90_008641 [Tulasnella sp. 427]
MPNLTNSWAAGTIELSATRAPRPSFAIYRWTATTTAPAWDSLDPRLIVKTAQTIPDLDISTMSSTATSAEASATTEIDPWHISGSDVSVSGNEGRVFFAAGSAVVGVLLLLAVCAAARIRMVRGRRLALGLPPPETQRGRTEDEPVEKPKPILYEAWASTVEDDISQLAADWEELHPLSATQILSEPAPHKPKPKPNPFKDHFISVLELFSVERMDKALLASMKKEDPPPEYTKFELVAAIFVAMPQPSGYDSFEGLLSLPELELGVHCSPSYAND